MCQKEIIIISDTSQMFSIGIQINIHDWKAPFTKDCSSHYREEFLMENSF